MGRSPRRGFVLAAPGTAAVPVERDAPNVGVVQGMLALMLAVSVLLLIGMC